MKKFVFLYALVTNLVLADSVTKEIAEHRLVSGDSVPVIPGFFDFALVHNFGCAWGMFQGRVWPLAVFGLFALVVLIWKRKSVFRCPCTSGFIAFVFRFAEPLLYAGIIGNVVDRLFRGYVIDMFDFHWKNIWHYPCFNLADVYICVAAGLLIIASLLESHKDGGDGSEKESK